jgi:branched-chain amino acid transport system substrate-binding protein
MSCHGKTAVRPATALLITVAIGLVAMPISHLASAAEDVTIGALLMLTGPGAPTGARQQRGIQFAVARANSNGGIRGRQIKVLYEDTQGKPDQGMLAFNRLVDLHHVPAVVTSFSSITLAVAPLATRTKVVLVNPMAQSSRLENASPYLFNIAPMTKYQAPVLAKFIVEKLGKKTAATIYENAAAGIDGKDDFRTAFLALGGKVLAEEPVEFGQTNFRPALLKIASTRPDVVYVSMTEGFEPFVRQIGQIENFPLGVGTNLIASIEGYAEAAGWYHTWVDTQVTPEIEAEYAKMFPGVASQAESSSTVMDWFAREYFNGTNIVLTAIDKVLGEGGPLTGEAVRKAIFAIKIFGSGDNQVTFETNTASRHIQIVRIEKRGRSRVE